MNETIIGWTQKTWNPAHGCSHASEGCRFCYAERISLSKGFTKNPWTAVHAAANVMLKPHRLKDPYKLKEPTRIFVNSMSDLFHEQIPDTYIAQVFHVMNDLPQHTFQILTKRPQRAAAWPGPWTPNIWQGTSIENRKVVQRLDDLRPCQATVLFVSFEPLLESLGPINLEGYHWVIIGGESGKGYRPMDHAWAHRPPIAVFFKQSAAYKTEVGTFLEEADGTLWDVKQYPGHLTPPEKVYDPNRQ